MLHEETRVADAMTLACSPSSSYSLAITPLEKIRHRKLTAVAHRSRQDSYTLEIFTKYARRRQHLTASHMSGYVFLLLQLLLLLCNANFIYSASTARGSSTNANNISSTTLISVASATTPIPATPEQSTLLPMSNNTQRNSENLENKKINSTDSIQSEYPTTDGNVAISSDFNADCSDPSFPEIRCRAHHADCALSIDDANAAAVAYTRAHGNIASAAPHDVRIDSIAKALARRHNSERHKLTVGLSWQMPSHNITRLLNGLSVEIADADSSQMPRCFFFNISDSNWTQEIIQSSPRLQFTSSGVFQFGHVYDVTVRSLPSAEVRQRFLTPADPHDESAPVPATPNQHSGPHDRGADSTRSGAPHPSQNCSKFSHEFASQWTAGFRRIVLHTLAHMIQVEFVGAPPQYCFEQYEIRLLDETATEMLHAGIVHARDMRTEVIDNATVYFGEFNFTNLELDRKYIPSLIPVERAVDGRCLCPVNSVDPYDNKAICSCVAADWKPIQLSRFDIVQNDSPNLNTSALPAMVGTPRDEFASYWPQIITVNAIILLLFMCAFLLISHLCQQRNRIGRVRFVKSISNTPAAAVNALGGAEALKQNGVGLYFEPADAASQTPLILSTVKTMGDGGEPTIVPPINVLLVYAHDCDEHDACVEALARFLRDVFGLQVSLDAWDEESIEQSTADYLSASVVNADKVVVINSVGASHRFQAKIAAATAVSGTPRFVVERNTSERLDGIFLPQLDLALQHNSIISARFAGTAHSHVLPILNGRLQYVLPNNLAQFVGALLGANIKQDPRLSHPLAVRLAEYARQFSAMLTADPGWFVRTHHRRAVHNDAPLGVWTEPARTITPLPLLSAVETEVTDEELPASTTPMPDDRMETPTSAIWTPPPIAVKTFSPMQRIHVQSSHDAEQPSATISFDSGLVATAPADNVAIKLPHSSFSTAVPLVTIIPASPIPLSPLPTSPEPSCITTVENDESERNTSSHASVTSLSQDNVSKGVHVSEALFVGETDLDTPATDSGVFTETLDHSIGKTPKQDVESFTPTTVVMITQHDDLKETPSNGFITPADKNVDINWTNGYTNLKSGNQEAVDVNKNDVGGYSAPRNKRRHKNNKNGKNRIDKNVVPIMTHLNGNGRPPEDELLDSGMIDDDEPAERQPQNCEKQRRLVHPS